jgi:hypothetical protein
MFVQHAERRSPFLKEQNVPGIAIFMKRTGMESPADIFLYWNTKRRVYREISVKEYWFDDPGNLLY